MGPKSKSPSKTAKTKSMEEMQEEMLSKLSILTEKISELEATLKATANENEKLHNLLAKQADEIAHLKDSLNEREQYGACGCLTSRSHPAVRATPQLS